MPFAAWLVLALSLPSFLTACAPTRVGGSKSPDTVLNQQREELYQLRREVETLEEKLDLQLAQLKAYEARLQGEPRVDGVDASDLPQAVKVVFKSQSGPIDTDNDRAPDQVVLYIQTVDQAGRFIPVAGVATAQLTVTAAGGAPTELASRTWQPKPFARTYRSGITGTHYTLELDLPDKLPDGAAEATAVITINDASTGNTLTAQKAIELGF